MKHEMPLFIYIYLALAFKVFLHSEDPYLTTNFEGGLDKNINDFE